MSKKKTTNVEAGRAEVQANLTSLIDAAKTSLFELDSGYSFIEEQSVIEPQSGAEMGTAELEITEKSDFIFDDNLDKVEEQDDFNLLEAAFQTQPEEAVVPAPSLDGTELESFESAQIEELEFITDEHLQSVVESILFATDRPVSITTIKQVFVGTNVSLSKIKTTIEALKSLYANSRSGVSLEDIGSGFQLRTKLDNMDFLRKSIKVRPFKLSGPALEVLAIVAYKQPMIKSEIDEIRGVESGHLLRALMEKNLCTFGGKSDLPGKPMLYETTRKFLEIFSLRNLKELPTLSQIDELLPEGIGDELDEKPKLHDITEGFAQQAGATYSENEEELNKITGQLEEIQTTTDFFEQEKQRQKEQRDRDKAQSIRDAMAVGDSVSNRDASWLKRYDEPKLSPDNTEVLQAQIQEEDMFKPESEELIDENDELFDAEIAEANDLADIDG